MRGRARRARLALGVLLASLGGCADRAPRPEPAPCEPAAIWQAVSAGRPAPCEPTAPDGSSALFLAGEFRRVSDALAALDAAGGAQVARVELLREREQLLGVATIRGWAGPAPEPLAAPAAQGSQKQ